MTGESASAGNVLICGPPEAEGIEVYTCREVQRVFQEHLNVQTACTVTVDGDVPPGPVGAVAIGTPQNNPAVRRLVEEGFLVQEMHPQGYSMKCAPHPRNADIWLLAIVGADRRGTLYGARDLEHYCLTHFTGSGDSLGKPSISKHAGTVADHSVFCRRTPFMHVALAEAQWNPDGDTKATVVGIMAALGLTDSLESDASVGTIQGHVF